LVAAAHQRDQLIRVGQDVSQLPHGVERALNKCFAVEMSRPMPMLPLAQGALGLSRCAMIR
jgi:hypothetical protein